MSCSFSKVFGLVVDKKEGVGAAESNCASNRINKQLLSPKNCLLSFILYSTGKREWIFLFFLENDRCRLTSRSKKVKQERGKQPLPVISSTDAR
jgi:hypothetical protein